LLGYDDFLLVNGIDMTKEDRKKIRQIIEVMMHTIGMWPEGLRHSYKRHGKIFTDHTGTISPLLQIVTGTGCGNEWRKQVMQKHIRQAEARCGI
jgi:hypothetical protein